MLGIGAEMKIFVHAVLTGIFMAAVYLSLRVLRRLLAHALWAVNIEDMLYWIFISLYLFVQIYHTSDGIIRWYFALGVVVGVAFMFFFAFLARKIDQKIYVLTRKKTGKSVEKSYKTR